MNANKLRLFSALLALLLCFGLFGCTASDETDSPSDKETTAEATDATNQLPSEHTTAPTVTEPTQATTEPTETRGTEPVGPDHRHVYRTVTHEATCAKGGYVEYICDCGETYTAGETQKIPHDYSTQQVEPSGNAQGYTIYTCKVCGHSYKDNFVWNASGDVSFFNDAAFIGDSVTLALRNHCMNTGALGNATFLCVGSYSVNNAVTSGLMLTYQGQQMTPQDALAACGAKKVFIMLGMNDIALFGDKSIDKAIENWNTMLARIREKNPDIQIYIQSATPIFTEGQKGNLNNSRMDQYNARLKTYAQENGCIYIDIASHMKDSTGGLAAQYCSDKYVHLTVEGCKLWIEILKASV